MQLQFAPVTIDFAQIVSVAPDQVKTLRDIPHFMFTTVCQITAKPIKVFGRIDQFNDEVLSGDRALAYKLMATALKDSVEAAALACGLRVTIVDPTPEEIKEKEADLSRGGFRMAGPIRKDFSQLMDILEDTIRGNFDMYGKTATITSDDEDTVISLPVTGPVKIVLNTYGNTPLYHKPIAKTKLMGQQYYLHIHNHRHPLREVLQEGGFMDNLDPVELQREVVLGLALAFPWMLKNDHWTNAILDFNLKDNDHDTPGYFLTLKKMDAKRFVTLSEEEIKKYIERCNFMANPSES